MLPAHEIQRIKQEMQNSKEDHIQKILVQKIMDLSKEIAFIALKESHTWIEAIDRIDRATKWVDPDYQQGVESIGRIAKRKLELLALNKNIDERN
ncbi:TPA: hypothetical protein U1C94_001393 [Streptococcus suis]|nr:hypothetical protein [Streptococcus suis]